MINGVLFTEDGNVQAIGTVSQLGTLIETIETVLPQLRQQEIQRKAQHVKEISTDVLEEELRRRAQTSQEK